MADIFSCIADSTRRHILRLLLERAQADPNAGEVSVGELVTELELSQPTVSKHLKVLRDQGLAAVREEGQHRYYRLDPAPLGELEEWLAPFLLRGGDEPGLELESTAESTVYAAWAGVDVGDRVGRAAAVTAHSARVALEAAQEKLQGAQKQIERAQKKVSESLPKVTEKLPFAGRKR